VEPAKQEQNRLVCSYVEGVASYQIFFSVCYHTAAKHVNVSAMSNLADEREIKHDATFPQLYGWIYIYIFFAVTSQMKTPNEALAFHLIRLGIQP